MGYREAIDDVLDKEIEMLDNKKDIFNAEFDKVEEDAQDILEEIKDLKLDLESDRVDDIEDIYLALGNIENRMQDFVNRLW